MTIINNGISNSIILLSQEPLSDRLKTASLNTLLGMGIVFAVLTLIILLISLFKFLPGTTPKVSNESGPKVSPVDNAIAQIVSQEEANLMNDYELVAVITATICEFNSENLTDTSADGFVVRSIRKINKRRNFI
ncbi:MAG: OadG family protein [Clostridiales bacterium]|jgi:Na+-transporting methylmalonyl-CoA/oxaloacetate decarboxylase gamma subunit|nr:OadG family protein [Clostridiales bacterium]